jgi:hypothetical protein
MADQLTFDFSLPVEAGSVRQTAVVYTALGGDQEGQLVYDPLGDDDYKRWKATVYLPERARKCGRASDARVMVRTITCGPWEVA